MILNDYRSAWHLSIARVSDVCGVLMLSRNIRKRGTLMARITLEIAGATVEQARDLFVALLNDEPYAVQVGELLDKHVDMEAGLTLVSVTE